MADSSSVAKSNGFPLWAKILVGLFAVLVLLALAVPYFLNVDRYRDTIRSAIAKATGRKVTLGAIHARLVPGAGVSVAEAVKRQSKTGKLFIGGKLEESAFRIDDKRIILTDAFAARVDLILRAQNELIFPDLFVRDIFSLFFCGEVSRRD